MRKCRWQLLHINRVWDIGAPVRLHARFGSPCIKEMIGVSLAGLLAKHRCVLAAAAGLVRPAGRNGVLCGGEQCTEQGKLAVHQWWL